jgi:hypothetical protein
MPFIFKNDPKEVIESFDELPLKLKEGLLRKGLINLLPKIIQ